MSLHKCAKFAVLRHTSCADFENGSFYDLFYYVSQLEYLNSTLPVKRVNISFIVEQRWLLSYLREI